MLCDTIWPTACPGITWVSILVLMEYALRQGAARRWVQAGLVSILVLMEYALRRNIGLLGLGLRRRVSILVLMEYALRPCRTLFEGRDHYWSLNPCFNGICSATDDGKVDDIIDELSQSLF